MSTAHKKFILAWILFLSLFLAAKITPAAALTVDPTGKVVIERRGEVLSRGSDEDSSGSSNTKAETTTSGGATIKTEDKKDGEARTETTLPSGATIKTRQEPDRTRIDIYEGGTKLRLERRDDRTVIKMEDENGEKVELPPGSENEVFKIEERQDKGQVRVST
ncbi:MAG: hypothetical protein HYS83_01155, partial [Candidatus Blackburnbacteria bacterium]|nr:hypothetical protein [Candidatus Blackburnbacteria bacterium]